jgi:GT2 family glycosyltransferase
MSLVASIVISTYNRADALEQTLEALADQTAPAESYEVIVVDDGSTDDTAAVLGAASLPCGFRTLRLPENGGVSAGRNAGMRIARGACVILLSDDLIVQRDFVESHVATLERFPGWWVVGGYRQLPSLGETPFGRYLERLEEGFKNGLRIAQVEPGIWELGCPTARNLSFPRSDLDRVGFFDERFRTTCEDQDLAERAIKVGIRFLWDSKIESLHNDQAGDLRRYCRFQERGAFDTVLFLAKHPQKHGGAPVARVNGYVLRGDGVRLAVKKLGKRILALSVLTRVVEAGVGAAERAGAPDRVLGRGYNTLIGLYAFRGWRRGLASEAAEDMHRQQLLVEAP